MRRAVQDALQDDYRSGRPPKFSYEQVAKIISVASQSPRESNRPVNIWTARDMADEMLGQNIVQSISVSRVYKFLRLVD